MAKEKTFDWSVIKISGIFFISALIFSAGVIGAAYYYKQQALKANNNAKRNYHAASAQYLSVGEEAILIDDFYNEFLELEKKGIYGEEHRLNWIETLRDANEELKLPNLNYEIASQQLYEPDFDINLGDFKLLSSKMTIKIGLLHEGDLKKLLEYLDKHSEGQYTVNECEFRVNKLIDTSQVDAENINASCELEWMNLKLASEVAEDFS